MNNDEARTIIEGTQLLAQAEGASRDALVDLFLEVGELLSVGPGEQLLHEGDVGGEQGYILLSGDVEVSREGGGALTLSAPATLGEMQQLNPSSVRTATVKTATECDVLKFNWTMLYMESARLDDDAQRQLQDGIEHIVWDRFHQEDMLEAPVFLGLESALRLKFCLTLLWISKRKKFKVGGQLFQLDTPQGSDGFLLMKGVVELTHVDGAVTECYAPDIIGITPDFEPQRKWTATAIAKSPILAFKFDWNELDAHLMNRAKPEDREAILNAIRKNGAGKFLF